MVPSITRDRMAARAPGRVRGYSLVELLVVLTIVALLAGMTWPVAELAARRHREAQLRRSLWEIREAIDAYRRARESGALQRPAGTSLYPPDLESLVQAHPDARPAHRGAVLRFLRRLPRDPHAPATWPAAQTWGLRSLASDPDRPAPGADVFDVYSLSGARGLDGTPLREW